MIRIRPARVLATTTVVVLAAGIGLAAPSQAATAKPTKPAAAPQKAPTVIGGVGSCTTSTGALVGVSYGPWSGPVVRGCSTSLSTGRALLSSAGFTLTGVQRFPSFICRIGNTLFDSGTQYPKPAQDACVNTPPAAAYWSFWTAKAGVNTWTYSPNGADADQPVNGEVEAWTFGNTDVSGTTGQPVFTPNELRAGLPATKALAVRKAQLAKPAAPGSTADVDDGLDYLTGRLVGGDHYETLGQADLGLTLDAAYALAAAGTRDSSLGAMTDYVAAHQNDFTLLDGQLADFASGGAVAKVALLAEMAGRDPRAFGGVDLVAGMDKLTCAKKDDKTSCAAKGNYRSTSSVFGQALGVIAQLRAGDSAGAAGPIAYLESLQASSGGFPSLIPATGSSTETDSTAIAAMTLALVPGTKARTALAKALSWLAGQQKSDGGFPGASGNSVNSAALSVQALRLDAEAYSGKIAKGEQFLAGRQNADGGFDIAADVDGSDLRASAQAVNGVVGTPFASILDDLGAKKNASDGAEYLISKLSGGDHYVSTSGGSTFDDQGLTADALFALLAVGGHADTVDRVLAYLKGQIDAYVDPSGSNFGPYSGSAAKLALVAQATNGDPHSFAGTDLLKVLTEHVCTAASSDAFGPCTAKGDFANAFSEISQALGILALQSSANADEHLTFGSAPVVRLRQLQCPDGGFSSTLITAKDKCTSEVDATGFAVQALVTVPNSDAVLGKAQHYLENAQKKSGLFPGAAGDNSNSTALAAVALQSLVTALNSETVDPPGPKAITPIASWQSSLTGLNGLSVAQGGGFGLTSNDTAELRASAQAVLAADQQTLVSLSGAPVRATPRDAAIADPGEPAGAGPAAGTSAGDAPDPAAPAGSAEPIGAPADTGVTTNTQLMWALLLLVLGAGLTYAGRRRVAAAVGRHREAEPER